MILSSLPSIIRSRRPVGILLALAALTVALTLPAFGVQAQSSSDNRSLHWTRWDVLIDNIDTTNNSFQVTETYDLQIDRGPFRGGFRNIPLDRIGTIDNIQVYNDGVKLPASQTLNCPTSQPGIACYFAGSTGFSGLLKKPQETITYTFRTTLNTNATTTIKIIYTVLGALRSYSGGDQLYWSALATDRSFDVQASRVTVQMPDGVVPQIVASYPSNWAQGSDGNGLLTFDAPGDLGSADGVEVRIQYPHNPAMQPAAWQSAFDRTVNLNPVLTVISLVVSGLILVLGLLFLIIKVTSHRRGLSGVVVPEYLTEPPSDLSPGVADALLHLGTETRDVLGTLLDMARRGYLVIEQGQQHGGFVLHRTDQPPGSDLADYERLMLQGLFTAGETRRLDDLSQQFYTTTALVQSQISAALVQDGYCKQRPERVRLGWSLLGFLFLLFVLLMAGVTYLLITTGSALSVAIPILPGIAFLLLAILTFIFAGMMPSRTPQGEQEAAKWKAFKHYLENLKRYNNPNGKAGTPAGQGAQALSPDDQFTEFIGYAVAFGVERVWLHEMTPTLTYFPPWYYPGYMYGGHNYRDYGYGYNNGYGNRPQMPNFGSGGPGGGGFDLGRDLNQATSGLTEGLNSLNSGLTTLLNSAGSTMTSRPQSSSSGGGGGFSGGGGGGGGSSGGGGAGFF